MRSILLFVALGLASAGCAVKVDWAASGGSRADGTIELSYEAGDFQQAVLDESQAHGIAAQRCKAWGYTGTEAFGAVTRKCIAMSGLGCARWLYTKKYQCLGTGSSPSS